MPSFCQLLQGSDRKHSVRKHHKLAWNVHRHYRKPLISHLLSADYIGELPALGQKDVMHLILFIFWIDLLSI